MTKPKKAIVARYPSHIFSPDGPYMLDTEWDTDTVTDCLRCGRVDQENYGDECVIKATYLDDNILEQVRATDDWLRDHGEDMKLFPPMEWIESGDDET